MMLSNLTFMIIIVVSCGNPNKSSKRTFVSQTESNTVKSNDVSEKNKSDVETQAQSLPADQKSKVDSSSEKKPEIAPDPTPSPAKPTTSTVDQKTEANFNLADVQWLDKNIANWPVTSKLEKVYFNNIAQICFNFDKYKVWVANDTKVVANNWVITQKEKDGKWYATTFEWFATYDNCKWKKAVAGDHMKKFNIFPAEWKPSKGQRIGFFLSTLVRNGAKSPDGREERTDIVFLDWPGD